MLERALAEREVGQQEELARIRVEVRILSSVSPPCVAEADTGGICEEGTSERTFKRSISTRDRRISDAC